MKLGLLAQDTDTGIGHQCWEFARAMQPDKVLILDMAKLNEHHGKKTDRHPERYADFETRVAELNPFGAILDEDILDWILTDIDVLFVVETPIFWALFQMAKQRGVKTVLQFNAELFDYASSPTLPWPDLLLAPSDWELDRIKAARDTWSKDTPIKYLPVPVATDRFLGKLRTEARKFVHVAGHKTYEDRNGTEIVEKAMPLTHHPVEFSLHSQENETTISNYWELYDGDVLLLPRRYGGLSLQYQEACAAGMVPVTGIFDPYGGGIKVSQEPAEILQLRIPVQSYSTNPKDLAEAIDRLYATINFEFLSEQSLNYAKDISWDIMKPKYKEVLEWAACQS